MSSGVLAVGNRPRRQPCCIPPIRPARSPVKREWYKAFIPAYLEYYSLLFVCGMDHWAQSDLRPRTIGKAGPIGHSADESTRFADMLLLKLSASEWRLVLSLRSLLHSYRLLRLPNNFAGFSFGKLMSSCVLSRQLPFKSLSLKNVGPTSRLMSLVK
jgi:hypothetical protein